MRGWGACRRLLVHCIRPVRREKRCFRAVPTSEPFNISEHLLDRIVHLGYGSRCAVIDSNGRRTTYSELLDEVNACSNALRRLNLRQEERVGILMHDRKEFIVSFLATVRIGCVALLLNPALPPKHLTDTIKRSLCRLVVSENKFATDLVNGLSESADCKIIVVPSYDMSPLPSTSSHQGLIMEWENVLSGENDENSPVDDRICATVPDSPCYWLCTSGTTGHPKIVMHRHIDMLVGSVTYGEEVLKMSLHKPDMSFSAAPMFHAYGFGNSINYPLSFGGTVILEPTRPLTPSRVSQLLLQYKPSIFYSVPSGFNALLDADVPSQSFSSIRAAVSAGEPLPGTVFDRFTSTYSLEILDGIGSSEASNFYCTNRMGEAKRNSCGTPVNDHEIQLRDSAGQNLELFLGCRGEMFVKSPSASSGYYCDSENSRKSFMGAFIATGDMFEVIENGHFKYMGRNMDVFKVKGQWVSPLFIEDILLRHPAVKEVAVIGHQSDAGLTEVVAFIVRENNALDHRGNVGESNLEISLVNFCEENHLPNFQIPTEFCFVAEIKKNNTGKIVRSFLRENYAQQKVYDKRTKGVAKSVDSIKADVISIFRRNMKGDVQHFEKRTLMELGLDSSTLTRIKNTISKHVDISYKSLYNDTVEDILSEITCDPTDITDTTAVNWKDECVLPSDILKNFALLSSEKVDNRMSVLLTGATGFLGMHILLDQLKISTPSDKVFVVVRGRNEMESKEKLLRSAKKYGLFNIVKLNCQSGRIVVICGDLSYPLLGLASKEFFALAEEIDVVIHTGAVVNWLLDYSTLRQANVGGTIELLRLCSTGVRKRFVYVSSVGAFSSGEGVDESAQLDVNANAMDEMNGYGASKRVSEILVDVAIENGLDGYICRPGTIGGSASTGFSNPSDTINRFLKSICQLSAAPILPHGAVSILPVETAVAAISGISKLDGCEIPRRCTMVGDPISMNDIISVCESICEKKVAELPLSEFTAAVVDSDCALFPVANFFENEQHLPLSNETLSFCRKNYLKILDTFSVSDPDLADKSLIELYLKNMQNLED